MSGNLGDDLKKLMMAGVGAFSTAAEKTRDLIDDLSQKGGETAQKTRDFIDDMATKGQETLDANQELTNKFKNAFENLKREASQLDVDEIVSSLGGLTDEALTKLRDKLNDLVEYRSKHPEAEASCADGDCCCTDNSCGDDSCEGNSCPEDSCSD